MDWRLVLPDVYADSATKTKERDEEGEEPLHEDQEVGKERGIAVLH